jgi:tubulin monoglycylase TTLL3/8
MNNLYDIANYCLGKDVQFVIQKYIENPLLVNGKKFDIRQWVLIEDYNPPVIWFYEECYLRFCADEYSLDNIHNKFMHLTNNSIQKHHKTAVIDDTMWDMKTFSEYVGLDKWKVIQ